MTLSDDLRELAASLGDGDQLDNIRGEALAKAAARIDVLEAERVRLRAGTPRPPQITSSSGATVTNEYSSIELPDAEGGDVVTISDDLREIAEWLRGLMLELGSQGGQAERLEVAADRIDELEALVNALDIQAMHPHMDGSHQCTIRANGRSLTPEQWDLILSCRAEDGWVDTVDVWGDT